jgi:hypothetical protein
MANPNLRIINGPGQRDLEQAFLARNLGARATFTLFIEGYGPSHVMYRILNFAYVTCQGQNYKLGGHLSVKDPSESKKLPAFNFVFVEYNAETKKGEMEFSNAE